MWFNLISAVPFNPSKIPLKSSLMQLHSLTPEAPGHLTFDFCPPHVSFVVCLICPCCPSTAWCPPFCAGSSFSCIWGADTLWCSTCCWTSTIWLELLSPISSLVDPQAFQWSFFPPSTYTIHIPHTHIHPGCVCLCVYIQIKCFCPFFSIRLIYWRLMFEM